jgi:hypothetical protein
MNAPTRPMPCSIRLSRDGAVVLPLWRIEILNAFQIGIRRKRIDTAFPDAALARLRAISIAVDPENDLAWTTTLTPQAIAESGNNNPLA